MKNISLQEHLATSLVESSDTVLNHFVEELKKLYDISLQAIIFYGSCMRSGDYHDAVLDFYLVVDSYKSAYKKNWPALLNKLLPPNVYFIQLNINGEIFQAKYSIISADDLQRYTDETCFHSYFWARLTQPIALLYLQKDNLRDWVLKIQQQAITTFAKEVSCMLVEKKGKEDWWMGAFKLTYAAELRTESQDRDHTVVQRRKRCFAH